MGYCSGLGAQQSDNKNDEKNRMGLSGVSDDDLGYLCYFYRIIYKT